MSDDELEDLDKLLKETEEYLSGHVKNDLEPVICLITVVALCALTVIAAGAFAGWLWKLFSFLFAISGLG